MEVQIISKECIKPSSPTPNHLKIHKLSFLDQHVSPKYFSLVLFYSLDQDTNFSPSDIDHLVCTRLHLLKQSLSETLSRFYPLAGRIKDLDSIDCNDEGFYFVEAKVQTTLNEFLNHSNISLISKFLPDEANSTPVPGNYVAGVQVTTFCCGGIAVCAYVTHMIADGTAISTFLKGWATTANKNSEKEICPKFDASSFFPQNEAYPREATLTPLSTTSTKHGRYITRRFLFDATAIEKLKEKVKSSGVQNPTRVEVVTALFGKCVIAFLKARSESESDKPLVLVHAVNLRRRAKPQFSEYYMGNFVGVVSVRCQDKEVELQGLVCKVKEEISKFDGDYVKSLQGDGGWLNFLGAIREQLVAFTAPADIIAFNSWCNFGFYDLDFGWGKPAWASIIDVAEVVVGLGVITFMDTREGNGVEAWACLLEEDMAKLEADEQFLAFATLDPSPLK